MHTYTYTHKRTHTYIHICKLNLAGKHAHAHTPLQGLPQRGRGEITINVTMSIDKDGILTVSRVCNTSLVAYAILVLYCVQY